MHARVCVCTSQFRVVSTLDVFVYRPARSISIQLPDDSRRVSVISPWLHFTFLASAIGNAMKPAMRAICLRFDFMLRPMKYPER